MSLTWANLKRTYPAMLPGLLTIIIMLVGNFVVTSLHSSFATWLLALPALVVLIVTAVARIYDITAKGKRWFFRRIGLIFVGAATVVLLMAPLVRSDEDFPSPATVVLLWGFALTWLTTPHMPPWWKYISGEYNKIAGDGVVLPEERPDEIAPD